MTFIPTASVLATLKSSKLGCSPIIVVEFHGWRQRLRKQARRTSTVPSGNYDRSLSKRRLKDQTHFALFALERLIWLFRCAIEFSLLCVVNNPWFIMPLNKLRT